MLNGRVARGGDDADGRDRDEHEGLDRAELNSRSAALKEAALHTRALLLAKRTARVASKNHDLRRQCASGEPTMRREGKRRVPTGHPRTEIIIAPREAKGRRQQRTAPASASNAQLPNSNATQLSLY